MQDAIRGVSELSDDAPKKTFADHQWKPGQSGNPKGRPARPSFESVVERILDEPGSDEPTKREDLARRFVDLVSSGEINEMRVLLARVWPEVKSTKIDTGDTDKTFTFGWKSDSPNGEED